LIAYLDSSILLRLVLGEPGALKGWSRLESAVASELVEVECLRTLDRLHLQGRLPQQEVPIRRAAIYELLEAIELVELGRPVIERASAPLPTALGTLDALHLVTALLWKQWRSPSLVLATHDRTLAAAAQACGLQVIGA